LIYFLKGILPASKVSQGGDKLTLFHIGLLSRVDETHASFERRPFALEAGACSTLFPCEN
jgi:hypothetical protein